MKKFQAFAVCQKGAVWSEFIVSASFLLIGFLLAIPLIAKVIDARQKTEMAARYATWERTVWFQSVPGYFPNRSIGKSNAEVQNEMHHRIFATKDEVLDSETQRTSTDNAEYDPFLNFFNRTNETYELMLPPEGEEVVALQQYDREAPGGMANALNQAAGLLTRFGDAPLNDKGFYQGEVTTSLKQFDWMPEFENVEPRITVKGAIFADAWNTDLALAEDRAVSLMFRSQLEDSGVLQIIEAAQSVLGIILTDIRPSNLEFFETDVNAVPEIRRADVER